MATIITWKKSLRARQVKIEAFQKTEVDHKKDLSNQAHNQEETILMEKIQENKILEELVKIQKQKVTNLERKEVRRIKGDPKKMMIADIEEFRREIVNHHQVWILMLKVTKRLMIREPCSKRETILLITRSQLFRIITEE